MQFGIPCKEIETAFGLYAGMGITIWAILQNLVQLESLYGKGWESIDLWS